MALRLPRELNASEGTMEIESSGDRWIVRPLAASRWPTGFFDRIRLEEPHLLERPDQGKHRPVDL